MYITFTVNDAKISHDAGGKCIVAGSSGEVKAKFVFDSSWELFDIVIVFSNNNMKKRDIKPIRYSGEPVYIPDDALVAGKLYVSVIGFSINGNRKTTLKWDMTQAITIQECGALGCSDILRSFATENKLLVNDEDIATDQENREMIDEVFGPIDYESEKENGDADKPSDGDGYKPLEIPEAIVATDEENREMIDEVFGPKE